MSVFRYLGRRKRRPAIQRNNYLPTRLRIESLETRALVTSDLLTGLPLALYSTSGEADSTPAIVATDTVTGNAATKFLQFSLAVHDDQGNSFSSPLVAGQTFWLDVYINDTRQLSDAGAVTVQTDVSFTQGLASATGNFTPGDYPGPSSNRFNVVNSNTVFAQGQIPLSGSNLPTPPGPGPQLIDRIQMTAQSPGTVSFQTQFPNSDPGGLQTIFLADTNEAGGGSFGAADPATIAQGTTSATIVAAPNISIAGGAATTGAGATQITFTASTATAIAAPLTVHYQTVQTGTDNAVAGTDFTAVSNGTVVIAANTLSKDFSISIPNNTQFQGDKTFHVQLTSVDGGLGTITTAGGADSALGTIHYTKPTVSIADSSLTVSTSATTPMPFTVSLNTAAAVDVHVQYQAVTTGADTAVAGTDYVSSLSTVTILAGHTTADFNVTLNALSPGADKTFHVNLLGADNGTIADGSALATVINHVPSAPTVSVGAATSTTTSTTLNFPVTRSGDLSQPITLNYQTSLHQGDTAVAGTDFTAASGSVTIGAGQTTASIPITIQHGQPGANPTFHVDISLDANSAAADLTTASVLGTIVNAPAVSLTGGNAGTVSATAGSSVPFTVSLPTAAASAVTVHYHTEIKAGDTAGANDFTAVSNGVVTIGAGSTSQNFSINLPAAGYQTDRTFHVVIDSVEGNAAIINTGANSALGTIHYTKPTLSVADAEATQGSTPGVIRFTVTLSDAAQVPVTVNYKALADVGDNANGASTLQPGVDFQTVDTTNGLTAPLVIAAGSKQGTIEIPIGVAQPGPGDKTFHVKISSADNATVSANLEAKGTIHDTLPALPKVTIGSAIPQSSSGTNSINFPIHLDKVSNQPITIDYKTGLQGNDAAVSGTDFPLIKNGQITIPANTQDAMIKIDLPAGSAAATGIKTFHVLINVDPASTDAVTLGSPANVSSQAPAVSITSPTTTVTSAVQTNMNFQVSLIDPANNNTQVAASQSVVVSYRVVSTSSDAHPAVGGDNLSTPGVDFVTVANGQVTILTGQKTASITVPIAPQLAGPFSKTLHVEITGVTNAYLSATGSGTGTIANNITKPAASIQPTAFALEPSAGGTTNMTFAVNLATKSSVDVVLNYQVTGGTAVAGTDFTSPGAQGVGTLTIPAGQQTGTITIPILPNANVAPSAQLTVKLTAGDQNATVQQGNATGIIQTNGSFGGFAFIDTNNDGKVQTGEQKLAGVTIKLDGTTSAGLPVHLTTVTGDTGAYNFANLAPGTYTATQSGLAGYTMSTAVAGTGATGTGTAQLTFTIVSGNNLTDNAFGERGLQSQLINKKMFFSSNVH